MLQDDETMLFGDQLIMKVIHTPGHTPGKADEKGKEALQKKERKKSPTIFLLLSTLFCLFFVLGFVPFFIHPNIPLDRNEEQTLPSSSISFPYFSRSSLIAFSSSIIIIILLIFIIIIIIISFLFSSHVSIGSCCFYFPSLNLLLSGDTLMRNSIGWTKYGLGLNAGGMMMMRRRRRRRIRRGKDRDHFSFFLSFSGSLSFFSCFVLRSPSILLPLLCLFLSTSLPRSISLCSVCFLSCFRLLHFVGPRIYFNQFSDHSLLIHSIRSRLYSLPSQTLVIPGHGKQTTIGYEKTHNHAVTDQFVTNQPVGL